MWHIYKDTNVFDSDAYGVDTDNSDTAYEIIDSALNNECERAIEEGFRDWLFETAREYFTNVGEWDEEWQDAWRELVLDII